MVVVMVSVVSMVYIRRLSPPVLKPAVTKITLPYKGDRPDSEPHHVDTLILLPHAIMSTMYKASTSMFWQKFLGGDHTNVTRFWKSMVHHPSYRDHPDANTVEFQEKMIPLDLHMDGVPITAVARKAAQTAVIYSIRREQQ